MDDLAAIGRPRYPAETVHPAGESTDTSTSPEAIAKRRLPR
jgi:hypothetical protein